jgi:hypothetical protein
MLSFYIKSENESLRIASKLTIDFFTQLDIKDMPYYFNHTSDTPEIVKHRIKSSYKQIGVEEYAPLWRFTKANAHAKGNTIFINKYKFNSFHVDDFVRILAHESMHVLGYGHQGNKVTQYNLKTVPYAIGTMAEAWARGIQ